MLTGSSADFWAWAPLQQPAGRWGNYSTPYHQVFDCARTLDATGRDHVFGCVSRNILPARWKTAELPNGNTFIN
jgi:hypothetical protein